MIKKTLIFLQFIFISATCLGQLTPKNQTQAESNISSSISGRLIEPSDNGLTVTYQLGTIGFDFDSIQSLIYNLSLEGFALNTTEGEPEVLQRFDYIPITENATPAVEIIDADYIEYNWQLSPASPLLLENETTPKTISEIIPYDGFFPKEVAQFDNMLNYRGQAIACIKVSPIQYDYKNKTVRIYSNINYKVSYTKPKHLKQQTTKSDSILSRIDTNDAFINNIALSSAAVTTSAITSPGYLILTINDYLPSVQQFIQWKKLMGFNTTVISRNDWTPDIIKSEIKKAYNKDKSLYYLLIIGNNNDIPAQIVTESEGSKKTYATDYYYGCLDGEDDILADIYRGRIPANSADEVTTILDKIVTYEQGTSITGNSFYNTAVHCASFEDDNPEDSVEDRNFIRTSESIRDGILNLDKNVKRIYYAHSYLTPLKWKDSDIPLSMELRKPNFAWDGSAKDIISEINNGAFYIMHRGHGGVDGWGDPAFRTKDISSLTNGSKLPIVFSINCLTGKFNDDENCFAYEFLRKQNGGCASIIAASIETYSWPNDVLAHGIFDAIWPKLKIRPDFMNLNGIILTPTPTFRLGQILDQAHMYVSSLYSEKYGKFSREQYHCLGDPSLEIKTEQPTTIKNVNVARNNRKVTVTLENDEATIVFYDEFSKKTYSAKGSTVEYVTKYPLNVTVCVRGHNRIPYINTITEQTDITGSNIKGPMKCVSKLINLGTTFPTKFVSGDINIHGHIINAGDNFEMNPEANVTLKLDSDE